MSQFIAEHRDSFADKLQYNQKRGSEKLNKEGLDKFRRQKI